MGIDLFGDVGYLVTDHVFDCIFVNTGFLCGRDKVLSSVMRTMLRVKIKLVTDHLKAGLIALIAHHHSLAAALAFAVEEIWTADFFGFILMSLHKVTIF